MQDKITIEFTREELNDLLALLLAPINILKTFNLISKDIRSVYATEIDKIKEIFEALNKFDNEEEK